jgi:hypothetical protein
MNRFLIFGTQTLTAAQQAQQFVQPAVDFLSQPRNSGCMAALTGSGAAAGASIGAAGVVTGPGVFITEPGGFLIGGLSGAVAGLTACMTNSGPSGGGGGGGSGASGSGHKYSGKTVAEILKGKKASIKNAPLEPGSPTWENIQNVKWEDIDRSAKAGKTGYNTIRKLLTDTRFDK